MRGRADWHYLRNLCPSRGLGSRAALSCCLQKPVVHAGDCPAWAGGHFLADTPVVQWCSGVRNSQTIATLHMHNFVLVDRILTLRIALGKILMTCLGLICGASIGREGPSVQIGASIMHAFSRAMGQHNDVTRHGMILAGAAGMAAAFNTPLAGVVFAIEELAHSFEQKASGRTLTVIIFSGITAIALLGNYTYFGRTNVLFR